MSIAKLSRRSVLRQGVGVAAVAALGGRPNRARAEETSIRFSCDFRVYGATSPFFYAVRHGLFRDVGVDATVDGASGSVDSLTRVASGTHDFGCADAASLVEFQARNPKVAPMLVMPIYDNYAAVVVSLKKKPIHRLEDLIGRRLGTAAADAGSRIFPAVLHNKGIDINGINRIVIDAKLRDTMLLRGEVDAVLGFDYTVIFDILGAGVPLEDLNLVYFSDNGFDFIAQGLVVNRAHIERSPDLVRRVALAVARAWVQSARNPSAALDAVMAQDPLLVRDVEMKRLQWVLDKHVLTANVRRNGLGNLEPQRLDAGLKTLQAGFQLPRLPTMEDFYDGRFMPPLAERRV